ncbi:DUF5959 family protein [Streptomyces rubradiris]|uniref:Uncharacterized protein n=1 Tax=Streptomyces rubradiris TaxID=285531 RepID=A0ABQ3R8H3_STRRR|nr:DUF5959 family protein [Streptomyces rubradiris]GHH23160.1 hypothetical protein GCM10018792_59570 [Streptomyces rubradiris]GHI52137.1 hypothetical protein Srubr_19830 [Streptomyces rubradiris]
MDLISLSDGDNGLRVRVLGRRSPGVPHLHDQLDAEVLITSSFVNGRLGMSLSPTDLEDWSRALALLDAGQDICWRDDDHSPEIRIQPHNEEHETPVVHVEDPGSSCVSVLLPMNLEEGWIDEQRRLLGQVMKEWPSEVLQSSPGVYEWRR